MSEKIEAALRDARAGRSSRPRRKMVRVEPPPCDARFAEFLEQISDNTIERRTLFVVLSADTE